MKKVYLSLFAIALASVSMAQGKVSNAAHKAVNAKKAGTSLVSSTKHKDVNVNNNFEDKVVHFNEDFEGDIIANGWTITSGAASTTTDPLQNWHLDAANGNPDGHVRIDYVNSDDYHDEYLTSPSINIPNLGCEMRFDFFTSFYWHVSPNDNVDIKVTISTDGGANFNDLIWQEDDQALLDASGSADWETFTWTTARFNMNAYVGQNVIIRFHYDGIDGAETRIDNVIVEDLPANDIQLTEAFTHDIVNAYDYSIDVASQMQNIVIGALVKNMGLAAATGATLNVTINDGTSDVYTTPATFDLATGAIDTIWIQTGLAPQTDKTYTISFSLAADDVTSNDNISTSYSTSSITYAQDFTTDGIYRFDQDDETAMGNIFQIYNATTLNAASVKFETGTTAVSAIIRLSRFNFDDANFNSIQAMEFVDEVEYTIPASAIGSGAFSNINFNAPVALEAGWNYVLEVRKSAGADRIFIGGSDRGDADFSTACYGPFGTGDAVNYYSGWGFSPAVRMSFVSAPTITSSDTDNALCSNETLTLTSSAAAGNTWTLDGTVIPNEVGTTLTVSAAGTYAAVVNGIASAPVVVSATNIDPTITNVFGTLAATQGGGATYVWVDCNNGNSPVVPAATGQTFAPTVAGNYGVIISLNGCTSTSECILGINENEAVSSFNVYPNPATENVEVSYALKNNSTVNVTITDLSGKVVYAYNLGNKVAGAHALNVNTTTFSNGIYVVNFATDNAVITEKLVIRK